MKSIIIAGLLATMSVSQIHATVEVLTGTLSTTKNLSASTCYELSGCYRVQSGGVLNIPQGTVIRCDANAALIIERNAQINATGTSSSPVIFTSAQPIGSRAPKDWNGISIAGNAPINGAGTKVLSRVCGNITGGGSSSADNSGIMQFVRIEYAGGGAAGDAENNALNLLGVGSGTTLDHVMVSYNGGDAFDFFGGTVTTNHLISYNSYKSDFVISDGYVGEGQFWTSLRLSTSAHDATGLTSNAVVIRNDVANSSNIPRTHPVLSNLSLFGPKHCNSGSLSSDFKNGIYLYANAEAEIYNSLIMGWPTGLFIDNTSTITNANVNGTIVLNYNTFYNNTTKYNNSGITFDPTGTGCSPTIDDWMEATYPCSMTDNIVRTALTGYSSSICGDYCSTAPTLTLATTNNVGTADFGWDGSNTFDHTTYRGSLEGTDWSTSWASWCPEENSYCSLSMLKTNNMGELELSPNPAKGQVAAVFESKQTGTAIIRVMDKYTGKILRSVKVTLSSVGSQRMTFDVSGLREGVYFVQLQLPDGTLINKAISVQ